jgi:hypothetical protein
MFAEDSIIELLDVAIKCNGKLKVPDYELERNTYSNSKQKSVGKPLSTLKKKHDLIYSFIFCMQAYFPCVSSSDKLNDFQKKYISSVIFIDNGEFYIDLFNLFNLSHRTNNSFIELRDFFVSYKDLILKHDNNKIYFSFQKETAPVRLELKVIDKNKTPTITDEDIALWSQKPFTPSVNDWLCLFSKSPFFRKNRWCWFTITSEGLLNHKESRAFMKKFLREKDND